MAIKTVFITTPGASTFTVPADFIRLVSVECIGGGGAGGIQGSNLGNGGGGGAYARSTSVTGLSAGLSVFCSVGAGGTNSSFLIASGNPGGNTWFNAAANAAPTLASQGALAAGGGGGTSGGTPGAGGSAVASVGDITFAGGSGASAGAQRGSHGGGGGAAGPGGVGGAGGAGNIVSGGGGSGATLTSAGTAGTAAGVSTTQGGAGGASAGQTGGTGGTSSVAAGAGANGGGGGGAFNDSVAGNTPYPGGRGGAGSIWTQTSNTGVTVCGTAPEDGIVVMTAPPGTVFTSVQFASYGNPTGTCGAFSLGVCHAANSVSIVSGYLIGNSGTINIPATNAVFGDPCLGTAKQLVVQATATGTATAGPGGGLGGHGGQNIAASNGGLYGGGGSGPNTGSGGAGAQGIVVFTYDDTPPPAVTPFVNQISGNGSKTIGCFFRTNGVSRMGIAGTRQSVAGTGWVFCVNRTTSGNLTYFHSGGSTLEVAAGIVTGTWYYGCVTYDVATATATLYVNGQAIGSPATSFSPIVTSTFNGVVAAEDNLFNNPFVGDIANLFVYNRALTQSEIAQNFQSLRGRFGI